jgi:hypothetical protein
MTYLQANSQDLRKVWWEIRRGHCWSQLRTHNRSDSCQINFAFIWLILAFRFIEFFESWTSRFTFTYQSVRRLARDRTNLEGLLIISIEWQWNQRLGWLNLEGLSLCVEFILSICFSCTRRLSVKLIKRAFFDVQHFFII